VKPLGLVIVLALAGLAYIYLRPSQLHLTLEMAASSPSMAQLFWNVGKGFNEDDSSRLRVSSKSLTSFDRLSFALPDRKLRGLRFDPLTNEGRVVIRNIEIDNFNSVLRVLPVSRVIPLHQIASRTERSTQQGDEVEFATTAGANDPGLTIILPKLLRFRWGLGRQDVAPLGIIYVGILASFLVVQNWLKIDRAFGLLSARISEGRFLNFDPFAVWVCAGLLALFCFACLLDLNGSSGGMHSSYGNGPGSELWVGSPQPVRVDEWSYVTPDILSQYFRADRFAVQDSALGDHNISLTGNIPVKHISTLFRPQFWSFFVLPPDYSFSVYWQAKALVLVGGIFIFLLWLTGSSAWGLAGALWYFFSPFTQWSYSWPSAFPEMVGSLCLGIVCCSYLTVGRSWSWLAVSALGAAFSLINFAMCAYPPHLIPLAWLGVAMMVSWLVARRSEIFTTQGLWPRLAAILIACLLVGGVGLNVYQDLKPAIAAVSDTIYPGRRVLPGGTLPVWKLASHYLPWTQNATNFPQSLGNICEGSGFLWLAPLTLLCIRRLALSPFQKAALIALWVCFGAIFCWCVFPMPAIFGHITALDRCTGARCLPALGLLNIAIVALTVTRVKQGDGIRHIYNVLLSTIMFTALLVLANQFLGRFFSTTAIVLGAFYLALLTTLIISAKPRMLAVLLIIPQALVFGGVNPVEQGMGEFTQSNFNRYIQSHRELLNGKWLVYSDMVPKSGFVAEAGCQVYTGTRYIPDIDHFKLFASRGLDINTFNRLGYLDAHAIAPGQPTRFIQTSPVVVEWDVAPTDPLLPQVGIRYLAFDSQPDPKLTEHLTALTEEPVDGFWLYKLPPATAAASSNPAH
jgi:hypothetical protein